MDIQEFFKAVKELSDAADEALSLKQGSVLPHLHRAVSERNLKETATQLEKEVPSLLARSDKAPESEREHWIALSRTADSLSNHAKHLMKWGHPQKPSTRVFLQGSFQTKSGLPVELLREVCLNGTTHFIGYIQIKDNDIRAESWNIDGLPRSANPHWELEECLPDRPVLIAYNRVTGKCELLEDDTMLWDRDPKEWVLTFNLKEGKLM
jgi:hypothetical protein